MNILYDYQTFALQSRGGISRYFFELIRRVAERRDHDVHLFMGLHINEYGLEQFRDRFRRFAGVKMPKLRHTLGLRLSTDEVLFRRFARSVGPGVYHQTYFYDPCPEWKGRRVVTVYDMIYELYPHDYATDDPTARNKAIAIQKADWVICISEHTRKDMIRLLNVPEQKTSVIYLGNSLTANVPSPALVHSPYLLYVGKRGGYKNFRTALQAFAREPILHTQFSLVCFGGGKLTREEEGLMTALGVKEKVFLHDGDDFMLANLYTHAAALIYPSLYEGFGIPPLEAMHYGCPVVVSNASSIPEVVGDAGLYFDPLSEEDIAEKLKAVVLDSSLRSTLIARGKERVRQFSWEKCASETLMVYERLQ